MSNPTIPTCTICGSPRGSCKCEDGYWNSSKKESKCSMCGLPNLECMCGSVSSHDDERDICLVCGLNVFECMCDDSMTSKPKTSREEDNAVKKSCPYCGRSMFECECDG